MKESKGHGEKLSRKHEQAIAALLTNSTISQAAQEVGVGQVTLWRWMKNPEFLEAYREIKNQAVGQAITKLQKASGEAVETLRTIMLDTESPIPSRVTAAKSIIEMALKAVEIEDIVKRIEELEKVTEQNGGK